MVIVCIQWDVSIIEGHDKRAGPMQPSATLVECIFVPSEDEVPLYGFHTTKLMVVCLKVVK